MNKNNVIKIELLAPAKNLDFGKEAINHGADAVYIGSSNFGARISASNSLSDIEKLVKYAHFFRAQVYITFNTILFDHELAQAEKLILQLYNLGIDGLIVQDMGILELQLPPVPLIASTQTHNVTPEKVRFFEDIGFKRVILARELSISDIENIRKNTSIELESFVHGALCMSYSGQCYMSQALCNRSGNRGECAQPCRSHYDLIDSSGKIIEKNKYLLSMKDLNLSNNIEQMMKVGISSFKIEGRLKDLSYIKNIVSNYRQTIDNILNGKTNLAKSSLGKCNFYFVSDPEKSFNRGYTSFNISNRDKNWITYDTQKALGKFIGKVTKVSDNYFEANGEELNNGDGICFFDSQNKLKGTQINNVKDLKIFPAHIEGINPNISIYRNNDISFEKKLQQISCDRKIGISIEFKINTALLTLQVTDEENNIINIHKEGIVVTAEKPDSARLLIIQQLSKLGDSSYYLINICLEGDKIPFIPQSVINSMRREAIAALNNLRNQKYIREKKQFIPNSAPYPDRILTYNANVINEKAKQFYQRHQSAVIEMAPEITEDYKNKVVMTTKYCIRYQTNSCPKDQKTHNFKVEPLYLKDKYHSYLLKFDCKRCVMEIIYEK